MTASYPTSIWDGDSLNRDSDDSPRKSPDWRDWLRLIEELANASRLGKSSLQSSAPNVLLVSESLKVLMNEATLAELNYHTLPLAAAGMIFTFIVNVGGGANGIHVVANTGDTIQANGQTSIAAGYLESTIAGSVIRLICVDGTEWIADTIIGTWLLETS